MNWLNWQNKYYKIIEKLGLNAEADKESADLLKTFFTKNSQEKKIDILKKLRSALQQPVVIAGAGPSLENDFYNLISGKIKFKGSLIAVDGATKLFQQNELNPTVVITDLDGDLRAIEWAIESGALTLIHAHGDNQDIISYFLSKNEELIKANYVWGTTQHNPNQVLFNFGGFSDGDRAIFLAFHFQCPLIGLVGFDFGTKIGRYSTENSLKEKSKKWKLQKFEIALDLINSFQNQHLGLRFNLTSQGQQIPSFPRISFPRFLNHLNKWYK
ncbi:MAG: 6-hydroxymethylpterin diphosphokinase MptE-like protein [Candidatus Hodarchaeota archaeon]